MRIKPDPIGEPRNPLAVFLLALSLLSGLLIVVGVPSAGSIESQLPHWAAYTWGLVLTGGSSLVLAGMYWQGDPRTGLLMKRCGFLALVVASVVYASTLILFIGLGATFASALVVGYGFACGLQYRKINRVVRHTIRMGRS